VLTMASRAERATSFGAVAEDYNRLRPSPPDEAVDWLLPAHCEVAVDLAAGTGLLTRVMARKVPSVLAIELDGRMAAVLREHSPGDQSPGVEVLRGRGEELPLADASVDAVLISSAWHWLDSERAVPELGRVLRDGGRLGLLWPGANPEVSWIRDLRRWRTSPTGISAGAEAGGSSGGPGETTSRSGRRREVVLPQAGLFESPATAFFEFTRTMPVDDVVDLMATYSAVITASEEERAAQLARVRAELERLFPGASTVDLPLRAQCWRADRVPRSPSQLAGS
jgi:SAM-dependent methyltransferase